MSLWGVARSLQVDRIGDATRAAEDARLVDYLAENRIPLELYRVSNLRTGVISSLKEDPAHLYFERGIPISINISWSPAERKHTLLNQFRSELEMIEAGGGETRRNSR